VTIFFQLCTSSVTRGNVYKLYKPFIRYFLLSSDKQTFMDYVMRRRSTVTSLRSRFFASRVINSWNSLPPSTNFSGVNAFKRSISSVDFSQFLVFML